jgi:hypothetical protein
MSFTIIEENRRNEKLIHIFLFDLFSKVNLHSLKIDISKVRILVKIPTINDQERK